MAIFLENRGGGLSRAPRDSESRGCLAQTGAAIPGQRSEQGRGFPNESRIDTRRQVGSAEITLGSPKYAWIQELLRIFTFLEARPNRGYPHLWNLRTEDTRKDFRSARRLFYDRR